MDRARKYIVLIIYFVLSAGTGETQNPVYRDAPKVTPGTTEAMQKPGFWIANLEGDPDKVIMTHKQIDELNKKNQTKAYEFTDINGKKVAFKKKDSILVIDPLSLKSYSGDEVKERLNRESAIHAAATGRSMEALSPEVFCAASRAPSPVSDWACLAQTRMDGAFRGDIARSPASNHLYAR